MTEVLVSYWQQDALLQLLLHAVRVLLQHAALLQQGSQQQHGAQQPEAGEHAVAQGTVEVAPARSVGLPELLSAVQELSKVCGVWMLFKGVHAVRCPDEHKLTK